MGPPCMNDQEVQRAKEICAIYQREHDVSDRMGQAVGIEPKSGTVWFGETGTDIANQMHRLGRYAPFYCVIVGQDYYQLKVGKRES